LQAVWKGSRVPRPPQRSPIGYQGSGDRQGGMPWRTPAFRTRSDPSTVDRTGLAEAGLANHHPRLKKQRKGRLVWEETPFLTHPGAGSGWVMSIRHQLRGYSKAKMKRRRGRSRPRLLPHKPPRVAQLTAPNMQTPGEQIYSLRSKEGGLRVCDRERLTGHRTLKSSIVPGRRHFFARA